MKPVSAKDSGLRWLWLAILVLMSDIGSKFGVMNSIGYGWENRIEVLPFFNLLYVHNYGAAFSFLSDAGGWQRWFFSAIALGVSGVLIYWMRSLAASNKMLNIGYALMVGGALGNLFDRLYHGYVIDFLDFYVGANHWPAFNFADMAICMGAGLLVIDTFLTSRTQPKDTEQ